jgi:type IV secretory pathway VirB2 component (pilin)
MPRWSQVHLIRQIQLLTRSKWARRTAVILALLLVILEAALAQSSPFDTGFSAIQSLFTGTIAKVASLVAIVIARLRLLAGRTRRKKSAGRSCRGNGHCCPCRECPELALRRAACKEACSRGRVYAFCAGGEGVILPSISWWSQNGASHRQNFDTPSLKGLTVASDCLQSLPHWCR